MLGWGGFALSQTIIYVDKDAVGSGDGTSWANAFVSLDDALNSNTVNGAEVWIADGVYTVIGVNSPFVIGHGEKLYGSFNGTETSKDDRTIAAQTTVLTGDMNGDDVGIPSLTNSTMTDNANRVVQITPANTVVWSEIVELDGLVIEGGFNTSGSAAGIGSFANPSTVGKDQKGLVLNNVTLRNNLALNRPALLFYSKWDHPVFEIYNSTLEDNVSISGSYALEFRLTESTVSQNVNLHIVNSVFRGNVTEQEDQLGSCGRFTNLSQGLLTVDFVNNTVIDNPQSLDQGDVAPFAIELGGTALAEIVVFANNNIFYNNQNSTHLFAKTQVSGMWDGVAQNGSWQNVQDFPDVEGLTNTHVLGASPFINYNLSDFTPITQFQSTGRYQAYLASYPIVDRMGNPRLTNAGQIGIGAFQALEDFLGQTELSNHPILAFPNPVENSLIVHQDVERVVVFNPQGQQLLSTDQNEISFHNLPAGIYILHLKTKQTTSILTISKL